MTTGVCDHLKPVEEYLLTSGHKVTFSGQAWSANCHFWIYFDTVLDCEGLIRQLGLGESIRIHENKDPRSGCEKGLECTIHQDGIMGLPPG